MRIRLAAATFLILVLVLLSPAPAQEDGPVVRARVVRNFKLDGVLDEWGAPPLVLGKDNVIARTGGWAGEADLSAKIHVGYTATDLVLAGRVTDDKLLLNPNHWWLGDEIEIFLDLALAGDEPAEDRFSDDDYQLILFPLAPDRTWGFTNIGGATAQGDGGFDGVKTAAERIEGEEGYEGFTFEIAIPLVNFPDLSIRRGLTIGFDVAVVDADDRFGQKAYMTWSRRSQLARFPSRFGRLVFEEDLPRAAEPPSSQGVSWIVPLVIVVAALLAILALWRLRFWLAPLTSLRIRTRLLGIAPLVLLLVLAGLLPDLVQRSRRAAQQEDLGTHRSLLADVFEEARKEGLLGTPETGPEPHRIMPLFSGSPVAPPERYEYRTIFVREPSRRTTLLRTPVIDYARALAPGETADFIPTEPRDAIGAVAVVHLEPDPGARRPLQEGEVVGRIRIFTEDGTEESRDIRLGYEVSDFRIGAGGTHVLPEGTIAWRDRDAGTHAEEISVALPETGTVVRVEIEPTHPDGRLVAHGVTLIPPDGGDPEPLPLVSRTLIGVPTNLWQGRPDRAEVILTGESEPLTVPLVPPVDRVWVFLSKPERPSGRQEREGPEMLSIDFVRADGSTTEPVRFRDGLHLWPEVSYSRRPEPRPGFQGRRAFRWLVPGDWPRQRDAVSLAPDGPVTGLRALATGAAGSVRIAGITQGRRIPWTAPESLTHFSVEEGTYRLRPEVLTALGDANFTWYRAGRALRTTLSEEGVVGSALPRRGREESTEERRHGGQSYLAAFHSLDRADRDVLEIVVPLLEAGGVTRVSGVIFFVLLGLVILSVLLLLIDLLSRLGRIRMKLTLGFAVTALVPLVLFFIGLTGVLERESGRTEETRLREQLRQIRAKLVELPEDARRTANALLSDARLLHPVATGDESYPEVTEEVLAGMDETASPFGGPGRVYVEDAFVFGEYRRPRLFPRSEFQHPLRPGGDPVTDLTYRWSRISVGGLASTSVRDGRRTIAVETEIDATVLTQLRDLFGGRTEILLFTLRGYPYAGTLEIDDQIGPRVMAERGRTLATAERRGEPQIRREVLAGAPYLVAYDVLRAGRGKPLALLGVAQPREGSLAVRAELRDLFFILAAAILVLEVIVGNILTRRLTGPLTALSRGARAVAKGRLRTRVEVEGRDEIATLAESFNRMTAELGRRIDELSGLNTAIRGFSGSLDRDRVLSLSVDAFRQAASRPDGLVIATASDDEMRILAGFRGDKAVEAVSGPWKDGLLATALAARETEILTDLDPDAVGGPKEMRAALGRPESAVVIPFEPGREERGAVALLFDRKDPGLGRRDLEFLSTLAQQVAIALETSRLFRLAIEDEGTGLYVHSYFAARLREETDRALATDRPLSVLLFSFAELREINESHGRSEGNRVLKGIVKRLRAAMGGLHVMARADRDTVEVLLPEISKEAALVVAAEVRDQLSKLHFRVGGESGGNVRVTPFIGIATCPDDARSAEFLLTEAQQALYVAVKDGTTFVDSGDAREEVRATIAGESGRYVFRSREMIEILETVDRIALSDVPILVRGETGVGKEVLAELVHEKSERRANSLVK
ncbi:MAG: diguanylate cyclase, partial [Planctomycetota bacterium]